MHPHAQLLDKLFNALNQRDAAAMAACYHPDATFHDIAFDLHGRKEIGDMWRMICTSDIRATFEVVDANDSVARVSLIDDYTFSDTGRAVHNVIDSRFRFDHGLIVEQRDTCDPHAWGAMAIGGVGGFLAGRVPALRRRKARRKLATFVAEHPERK